MTDPRSGGRAPGDPSSYDVVVIGFGPVGQMLTILLAQRGHRVAVVERHPAPFSKPRAVVLDDEIARVIASVGLGDRIGEFSEPVPEYVWQNAAGETLLRFDVTDEGASGWPESNMLTQPVLERVLCASIETLPNVTVLRSTEAIQLRQDDDLVEVTVHGSLLKHKTLRGRYVVGCDGANSFVRQRMNTTVTDLGFFYDWLICDLVLDQPREWSPVNLQVCDPARPTTRVSGGPGRRRFEFMRMPHETAEEFDSDETAWSLLAPYDVTRENATLEKRGVYTFQARWADRWRDGRLFIAGDAAHLMPPFRGQGMNSGVRDSANLAWKLDLVLRGLATDELLDTYTSERSGHVQYAIHMSVELGRVICETDPAAVAARDAHLIGAGARPEVALPPVPPPMLGPGALQRDAAGTPVPPAGQVAVQGRVRDADGVVDRFDQVAGVGFRVLVDGERAGRIALPAEAAQLLDSLDARVVRLVPAGSDPAGSDEQQLEDLDGVMLRALRAAGHAVQVVRPDAYVFGGVAEAAELPTLLADLDRALGRTPVPVSGG